MGGCIEKESKPAPSRASLRTAQYRTQQYPVQTSSAAPTFKGLPYEAGPAPSAPSAPSAPPAYAPNQTGAANGRYIKEMATVPPINPTEMRTTRYHENRDYVVVVDRSGSMNAGDVSSATGQRCRRWDNVGRAVQALVVQATEWDEDGIDLYLFSTGFDKFENVDSAEKVMAIFDENKPKGSTDLAGVLEAAFQDHFAKYDKNRPTTILVITDGEPNSESAVVKSICNASDRCRSQTELSVTFVQVGDDARATSFLRRLDDELPCKHDIVDTLKDDCLQSGGLSFEEIVHLSVTD